MQIGELGQSRKSRAYFECQKLEWRLLIGEANELLGAKRRDQLRREGERPADDWLKHWRWYDVKLACHVGDDVLVVIQTVKLKGQQLVWMLLRVELKLLEFTH
jgi:hypothetical protein